MVDETVLTIIVPELPGHGAAIRNLAALHLNRLQSSGDVIDFFVSEFLHFMTIQPEKEMIWPAFSMRKKIYHCRIIDSLWPFFYDINMIGADDNKVFHWGPLFDDPITILHFSITSRAFQIWGFDRDITMIRIANMPELDVLNRCGSDFHARECCYQTKDYY